MMARSGSTRVLEVQSLQALAVLIVTLLLAGCVPPGGMRRPALPGDTTAEGSPEITRVMGARIHAAGNESSPPILRLPEQGKASTGDALTLNFEMITYTVPNQTLLLVACHALWRP